MLVDDHAMFRSGVRGELAGCLGGRGGGRGRRRRRGGRGDRRAPARRGAARRPPARRRRGDGDASGPAVARRPATSRCRVSDAAEDVIGTIRGGARGYVTKTITGPELVDAIRRVADGDAVFSPRLAGFVLDAFAGLDRRRRGRRGPRPAHRARARGDAADRPRLRLQGGGQASCSSPSRPSRPTCPRCCASSSSPRATSSPAGPPTATCSEGDVAACRGWTLTTPVGSDSVGRPYPSRKRGIVAETSTTTIDDERTRVGCGGRSPASSSSSTCSVTCSAPASTS